MNERIKELIKQMDQAGLPYGDNAMTVTDRDLEYFAELIVAEAFRAGMMYSAKKYADEGSEHFTGNDVAMFLEMEACELSDEDIKEHFGVGE